MSNIENENKYPLQILWDKWKHSETLAYSRWTSSMILQASVITATVISMRILVDSDINQEPYVKKSLLLALFFIWGVAAFVTYVFIKSKEIDLRVRNTFNRHIVDALLKSKILEGDKEKWRFNDDKKDDSNYKIEDSTHPINLWHTPDPFDGGKTNRATKWNGRLMCFFLWLNITVSLLFISVLFCPLAKYLLSKICACGSAL